jgi:cobalt/nickel transport system permease protein
MSFRHLDQYAGVRSPVTALPPVARVAGAAGLAIGSALLPIGAWPQLAAFALLATGVVAAARLPIRVYGARLAVPLALTVGASIGVLVLAGGEPVRVGPLTVTDEGLRRFGSTLGRGVVALSGAVVLVSTTTFPDFVHALRRLRLPRAVTSALGLAYRLLYLLQEEFERLERAARSRNAGAGATNRRRLVVRIAAALMGRTFHRAERTHRAMLARGYDGDLPSLASPAWNALALISTSAFLGLVAGITASAYLLR